MLARSRVECKSERQTDGETHQYSQAIGQAVIDIIGTAGRKELTKLQQDAQNGGEHQQDPELRRPFMQRGKESQCGICRKMVKLVADS
jgi:hypothetical protein